jgi:CPA2 family monovalent cation:H+ antiporter-2
VDLILTLAGALGVALVLGYCAQRIGLSPIVGYLLAGICVGPFTPGIVVHPELAHQMADIGVVLLMFGVGLHFRPSDLLAVRNVVVPGAIGQILATTAVGAVVATLAGLPLPAAIVLGLSLAIASTVVVVRILGDNDLLHTSTGRTAVGWLVVEDVFSVVALVVLPSGVGGAHGAFAIAMSFAIAFGKVALLSAFTLVVGRRIIPRLLASIARSRSRELFTLAVLVIALGVAVGSARLFGASMALGAFLGGVVVGQSTFGARAASEALPMRDAFAVLFFVSVGMLLEPRVVLTNALFALAAVALVLVWKPIAAFAVMKLLRTPTRKALALAAMLAQIGEFSFILVGVGKQLGILSAAAEEVVVFASMVSMVTSPIVFRFVTRLAPRLEPRVHEEPSDAEHRAVVVGYGPVGKTLSRLLEDSGVAVTIVDLNHETVAELRARGVRAVYGDASRSDILEAAGLRSSATLVFAASGSPASVIRAAKEVVPNVRILARAPYVAQAASAREAGADVVVVSEVEVAFAMTEHLVAALGASPEQLDRARERIRNELAGA